MNLRRWLMPGIGIKRWLLVVFAGLLLLALATAHLIRQLTRDFAPGGPGSFILDIVTLQFLPYALRGFVIGSLGLALIAVGSIKVVRAFMDPFVEAGGGKPLVEVIYQKRFLARGPRIVAIGGGTGLSTLLRGLKEHTSNLTAVVTVADDGGSSGVLREELGIPPVGDIRNCIAALADAEPLMHDLLQYRFPAPATGHEGAGLSGHALGNLLIAAMTEVTDGDFEEGVRRINHVLAVRGHVLPASSIPLTLHAQLEDDTLVDGQSNVSRASGIRRVWVTPDDVRASRDALAAIAEADLVVLGPGSLYTSVLPSLLLPEIRAAVVATPALCLYICNVATQAGETQGYDLADHVDALIAHTDPAIVDVVMANNQFGARVPSDWRAEPIRLRWPPAVASPPRLVLDDIVAPDNAHHHDPGRLAAAVVRQLEREGSRHRAGVARTA